MQIDNKFKYYSEMDLSKISLEPLTNENYHLVEGFSCGNIFFDEFLAEDAIYETLSRIYLIVYDENVLLGFFGLSATGLSAINISERVKENYNKPAVEISYFAIDINFQHMLYNEKSKDEIVKIYLSNIVFAKLLQYIEEKISKVIGFNYIILYSVPEAVQFYKKHGFEDFNEYMIRSNKQMLSECVPLFVTI